jgi:N-methylhydantoinase A
LHAAAVARVLGIPKVIVPQHPGVFSALGLLLADIRVDKVWTQAFRSNNVDAALVNRQFERITERALGELRQEGFAGEPEIQRAINMRYFGQNYEHEVQIEAGELDEAALERAFRQFDELHASRYGYAIEREVIELVSFKVAAIGKRPPLDFAHANGAGGFARSERPVFVRERGWLDALVAHRSTLEPGERIPGPAVIEEEGSTVFVEAGMTLERTDHGALVLGTGVGS